MIFLRRPFAIRCVLGVAVSLGITSRAVSLDPNRSAKQYVLQSWGVEEGLPQSTAQAVLLSSEGYLWIATQEGLARFDGVRFRVFDRKSTPEFLSDFFTSLAQEPSGALWAGSLEGLVRYSSGSFRTFTTRDGLPGDDMRALTVDRSGRVWAGTRAGLARWDGSRFEKVDAAGHADRRRIQALCASRDGSLWVGSDHGIARLAAGSIKNIGGVLENESVLCIREEADGSVLVGTRQGGLFRLNNDAAVRVVPAKTLGGHAVYAVLRDGSGTLWVGTLGGGLLRLQNGSVTVFDLEGGEGENGVRCLLEDREGGIWISTMTGGLIRLHDGPFQSYSSPEGLPSQAAQAVLQDTQGNIWVASASSLSRMPLDGKPIRTFVERDGVPPGLVTSLHEDRAGRLWVGSSQSGGLAIFEGDRFRPAPHGFPAFGVQAMAEDSGGRLWIGTDGGGIAVLQAGVWKAFTTRDGLASDSVHDIAFAADGALWAASFAGGLSRYRDGHFSIIGGREEIGKTQILSLHADADGSMWVGTLGKGLYHVEASGRMTSFTKEVGLCDDVVYSILEDGAGYLWTSNNHGVGRVKKQDLLDVAAGRARTALCSAYGRSEGLRFGECNGGSQPAAWKARDGRFWFVIRRGVAVVDPAAVAKSTFTAPPDVVAEELLVNRHLVANGSSVTTGPGHADVEIHFTTLNMEPETTRFRVQLAGYDADWVDAGARRTAYYTNLSPGTYRFEAAARTSGGPWGVPRALFEIHVPPRFFQRKFFWFFVAAGALGLVGAFYGGRLRTLKRREAELARRVEEEMAHTKILRGLLPICASCKKIRDDKGYWNQIESYIHTHSEAEFSHGICPECMKRLYPEYEPDPPPA